MHNVSQWIIAVAVLAAFSGAHAQDKAAYDQRSAKRNADLFQVLDRDGDGVVTLLEAQGDLNFMPIFNDMDINRDGAVDKAELDRYLELQYGVRRN